MSVSWKFEKNMAKKRFDIGEKHGGWILKKRIPGGGNGSIWTTVDLNNKEKIIKLLRKSHETARKRFADEIKIMIESSHVPGVMKIIDNCDYQNAPDTMWYVMEKGIPLQEKFYSADSIKIVKAIIEVGNTLVELHEIGISHRDIKPQNIICIDNQILLADFGLVDYPEKEEGLTIPSSQLGPRWTIAPEMRNNPENADGLKADVYSLAKSLWILLTGITKGFEGQYSPKGSIGLKHFQPSMYLNIIEDLLVSATENDPTLRPSIDKFVEILNYWIECHSDFIRRNSLDWQVIQQRLFPTSLPSHSEWCDIDDIISILNIIGGIPSLNHLFFASGGGLDLEQAKRSSLEYGLIEVDLGTPFIFKPKVLIFESFKAASEWNYFRLECEPIPALIEKSSKDIELVTEVNNTTYEPYSFLENYEYGYYDDDDEPELSLRYVKRILRGAMVIFQKTSSYNLTSATYDGRHNLLSAAQFRNYIQKAINSGYKVEYVKDEDGNLTGKMIYNGPLPSVDGVSTILLDGHDVL